MGNGMNKIVPGIYVGNIRDAKDHKQLEENSITHILAIHDQAKKLHPELEYLCIGASDHAGQDLTQFFSQCNDFIHKARLEGGSVLIHCLAGVSRSVTVTTAYIMTVTNLSWRESLSAIRGSRRCANPNYGFQRQLQDFQHEKLEQERKRLAATFPPSPHDDEEECKKLIESHRRWVIHGDTGAAFDYDDTNNIYPLPHKAYEDGQLKYNSIPQGGKESKSKDATEDLASKLREISAGSQVVVSKSIVRIQRGKKGLWDHATNSEVIKIPIYRKPQVRGIFAEEIHDPDDFYETPSTAESKGDDGNETQSTSTSEVDILPGKNVDNLSNVTNEKLDEIFQSN